MNQVNEVKELSAPSASSPRPASASELSGRYDYNAGVWFQSAVSGLWYDVRGAAGDIRAIRVDGEQFRVTPMKRS